MAFYHIGPQPYLVGLMLRFPLILSFGLLPLLFCLCAVRMAGQTPDIPDSLARQQLSARTERFASTHLTSFEGDYRLQQGSVLAELRGVFLSTTTLAGTSGTKDQFDGMFDTELLLPTRTRLFLRAEGTLTNDFASNTSLIPGVNNTAGAFFGVGQRVYDSAGNRFGVAVGGALNRQLNVVNAGLALYAEGAARLNADGYRLRLDGTGRFYNTSPRQNVYCTVTLGASRQFEEGGSGDLQAGYDYIGTDLYIKRREEDVLQYGGLTYDGLQVRHQQRLRVNTLMTYPAAEDLGFDLNLSLTDQGRSVYETSQGLPPLARDPEPFRHHRSDFSIGASLGMRWTPGSAAFQVRMEYSTNEQRNTVDPTAAVTDQELTRKRQTDAQNDFVSQHLTLSTTAEYHPGSGDTLLAMASIGIQRYDTPSLTNYFDRDEQAVHLQVQYAASLSPVLSFSLTAQAFLTHLVYLFGQNSNDNNVNRAIRLTPSVMYVPGQGFSNTLQAEVSANYTEYDFEGRTQNIRGRSFRQLRLRDSMTVDLHQTLWMDLSGELRIADRGSFSWAQFAERPLERVRTEVADASLRTSRVRGAQISVGARAARVSTSRTTATTLLAPYGTYTSIGPTMSLTAQLSAQSDIRCSGWWEHRFDGAALKSRVPSFLLSISVRL